MKKVKENDIVQALRMNNIDEQSKKNFQKRLLNNIKSEKFNYNWKNRIFNILNTNKQFAVLTSLLLIMLITGFIFNALNPGFFNRNSNYEELSNFEYSSMNPAQDIQKSTRIQPDSNSNSYSKQAESRSTENLGFAVGGAKDISSFRDNIKKGYLPLPSDISVEGLYYDYYFDTGKTEACKKLFCPSYSTALTMDKFSGIYSEYITVGLNSGIKESDFKRPPLNLMIVLDISGSMSSSFSQYYYDSSGTRKDVENYTNRTKLEIAKDAIIEMTKKLNDGDSLGIVLFDDDTYIAKSMKSLKGTNMEALRNDIRNINPKGGTNMEKGLRKGQELLKEYIESNTYDGDYENRVIFLTDAMPNQGSLSETTLKSIIEEMSQRKIYSTFVGIGVDFNSNLIQEITDVRGANYFSVNSESEFKKTIYEDFDLIVTPIVFDLKLEFEPNKFDIAEIYGVPGIATYNPLKGFINIKTLFPSRAQNGEVRGGIILLKFKKVKNDNSLIGTLKTSYISRTGSTDTETKTIESSRFDFGEPNVNYFIRPYGYENTGIRKAILLKNYANLMQSWILEARNANDAVKPLHDQNGIYRPETESQQWERISKKLVVSDKYRVLFKEFKIYAENEIKAIEDITLQKEIEILDILISQ